MEIQTDVQGGENPESLRAKTSLRLQYEAQALVLRRQMKGLLGVQAQLGLSARKICQLLLVDPSAWSRWMKNEDQVPPHVWRSLQWYMALQEKIPGLSPGYFLSRDPQAIDSAREIQWAREKAELQGRLEKLEKRLKILGFLLVFGVGVLVIAGALFQFGIRSPLR